LRRQTSQMLDPLSSMFDGIGTKCFTPLSANDQSRPKPSCFLSIICFSFVSKRRHRVNQESYLLQAQACSLEQRHPIQHARGNVKFGKRSTPLTDQSNSRYRCQAQLPTITCQAPGPPAARSTRVSSPSAISGLAFWVKSSECPHISQQSIQIDRQIWGEH
jgi:hypothetical protein